MASRAVKEKLQRSILSRRSVEQAEAQRETPQIFELDVQQEPPHAPASPQHRASDFVLKHKTTRCSNRRKDPLHNSFNSSRNSFTYQSSPFSNQSDQSAQMDRNLGMKLWVPAPVTVPHENHFIVLKHVYMDTALYTSPQMSLTKLDVLPGAYISVRQHRPLHSCQSQPLILNELPSGIFQRRSLRVPERLTHGAQRMSPARLSCEQRHPVAEERTAAQDTGRVLFTLGENSSMKTSEELAEEHTGAESSCSPHHQWLRRPALKKHNRLHQTLRHVHSAPSTFILPNTADHAPGHAPHHTHQTGLVYDPKMLTQQCICGDVSCEMKHAGRIPVVFNTLQERGVSNQCKWLKVTKEACHPDVAELLHHDRLSDQQIAVLREAAGGVINLMTLISQGQLMNGFAIVQPLGHDSLQSSPSTSVANFSSVAIAAKQLQKHQNKRKVLILDWDVHYCNTTQDMFYTDPNILHISLHRQGNDPPAFPNAAPPTSTNTTPPTAARGRPEEVGSGDGEGFNVNVEWPCDPEPHIGDAEFLAAFRTLIRPVALNFCPEFILISTHFNCVQGHPENPRGTGVSAKCFGLLTQNLMELCGGRVVVVLERGHDLTPVCEASTACVSALLNKQVAPLPPDVLIKKPCAAAVQSLHRVLQIHSQYWPSVRALIHTVGESWLRAEKKHSGHADTTSALASLSVTTPNYTRFWGGGNEPVEHDEDEDDTATE